ncbi:MAG: ferritin-like domain-containing protein [Ilumatobacter sp.]|uniref:ferritin-like domain-containing protein n=1 Tax=Ilumatobacter sp. TaxID=1967498 RepID=UPI003C759780
MSRRSLVTLAGAAGLGGLAAALLVDRAAFAADDEVEVLEERPNVPTASDIDILEQVIGLEFAASELYRARQEAGVPDGLSAAVLVMAENHQAYGQAIAGASGLSAGVADAEFVQANTAEFTGSFDGFLAAAHSLEQTTAATHTELMSRYDSDDAIRLTASIALTEVRQATVLADLLGVDDLDVLFGNEESALTLGDDA